MFVLIETGTDNRLTDVSFFSFWPELCRFRNILALFDHTIRDLSLVMIVSLKVLELSKRVLELGPDLIILGLGL